MKHRTYKELMEAEIAGNHFQDNELLLEIRKFFIYNEESPVEEQRMLIRKLDCDCMGAEMYGDEEADKQIQSLKAHILDMGGEWPIHPDHCWRWPKDKTQK